MSFLFALQICSFYTVFRKTLLLFFWEKYLIFELCFSYK